MHKHLTDQQIQELLSQPAAAGENYQEPPQAIDHAIDCSYCKSRIENYRLVFRALEQQPAPAFNADIAGAVLTEINRIRKTNRIILAVIISISIAAAVAPIIIFSDSIKMMLGPGLPPLLPLLLAPVLCILLFQLVEVYRQHRKLLTAIEIQEP